MGTMERIQFFLNFTLVFPKDRLNHFPFSFLIFFFSGLSINPARSFLLGEEKDRFLTNGERIVGALGMDVQTRSPQSCLEESIFRAYVHRIGVL